MPVLRRPHDHRKANENRNSAELALTERRIAKIVEAISDGVPTRFLKDELLRLEGKRHNQAIRAPADTSAASSSRCSAKSAPTGSIPDEKSVRFLQIFSSKFQRDVQERLLTPVRLNFCWRNVIFAIHYLATKTSPPGIGARGRTA